MDSAEIYLPDSKTSCTLPNMLLRRYGHTQDGDLVCGSWISDPQFRYCSKWKNGVWNPSHSFKEWRVGHVSWATASGVYLMGGMGNMETSALVKEDGSVTECFNLKYQTKY